MVMMNSIAYIFWDPVREMFTMPLLGRPVMWYGFFFVFGFILGYFIGIPIFKKVLGKTKVLLDRDIANWPQLLRLLRRASQQDVGIPTQIVNAFDPNVVHKLQELTACEQLKKNVLKELNRVAETMQISRDELIKQFPKTFNSLQDLSMYLTDRLMWFVMSGAIIGARLGHVFFYEWPYFSSHPAEIVKIWNGGLASHGGTIGILLALLFYWRYVRTSFPELSLVRIMDILSIPTALAAYFIRVGNFVNQEIIGTETALPWGVLFAHPANGAPPVPRHPAQLYEGIAYLLTFALLMIIWRRKGADIKPGVISGLFFVCVFGSRFLVEFVKMPLSSMVNETYIQTGQVLSIPFILLGCWLIAKGKGPTVAQTLHQE